MRNLIATPRQRLAWALTTFLFVILLALCFTLPGHASHQHVNSPGDLMKQFLALPMLAAVTLYALLTACAVKPAQKEDDLPKITAHAPFRAQVVGLQWLNPLQRLDYPTEWQLLWTLGLAKPNKNDEEKCGERPGQSLARRGDELTHRQSSAQSWWKCRQAWNSGVRR